MSKSEGKNHAVAYEQKKTSRQTKRREVKPTTHKEMPN
jgi:hypothetical protein